MNMDYTPCERAILRGLRQMKSPATLADIVVATEYKTYSHVANCIRSLVRAGEIIANENPVSGAKEDRYLYTAKQPVAR